jgi:hypothetical protein
MQNNAMIEARQLSAKALDMMTTAHKIHANAEVRIMNEWSRASTQLCQECAHSAQESARLRGKLVTTINKLNREHKSSINQFRIKSNKKYEKARNNVIMLLSKLKDQCITWQKKLSNIDCYSKNLVSKERACRCNTVQQQLKKTAAVESQLLEIIETFHLDKSVPTTTLLPFVPRSTRLLCRNSTILTKYNLLSSITIRRPPLSNRAQRYQQHHLTTSG